MTNNPTNDDQLEALKFKLHELCHRHECLKSMFAIVNNSTTSETDKAIDDFISEQEWT